MTGKRKNASGRYLGKITLEDGFIPADQAITQDDINSLDCGQYLIGYKNSSCVYDLLKKFFNPNEAKFLYCMGLIFFANGYTYMRDVINCYEGFDLYNFRNTVFIVDAGFYSAENIKLFSAAMIFS